MKVGVERRQRRCLHYGLLMTLCLDMSVIKFTLHKKEVVTVQ